MLPGRGGIEVSAAFQNDILKTISGHLLPLGRLWRRELARRKPDAWAVPPTIARGPRKMDPGLAPHYDPRPNFLLRSG